MRRAVIVLPLPARRTTSIETSAAHSGDLARDRARRALLDARRSMGGVIGEEIPVIDDGLAPATPVSPDLEHLQRFLEDSQRERATLRSEVSMLRDVVETLRARLELVERLRPPAPADCIPSPRDLGVASPEPAPPSADTHDGSVHVRSQPAPTSRVSTNDGRESAAIPPEDPGASEHISLLGRVFPAGTVGTLVDIVPGLSDAATDQLIEGLTEHPLIEHAERARGRPEATAIRVTLRAPMRWTDLRPTFARALRRSDDSLAAVWERGALRVNVDDTAVTARAEPA